MAVSKQNTHMRFVGYKIPITCILSYFQRHSPSSLAMSAIKLFGDRISHPFRSTLLLLRSTAIPHEEVSIKLFKWVTISFTVRDNISNIDSSGEKIGKGPSFRSRRSQFWWMVTWPWPSPPPSSATWASCPGARLGTGPEASRWINRELCNNVMWFFQGTS